MNIFEDFNVTRHMGKLKNGIKVILFYRAGSPITTSAILNSGSRNDPETMPGVAHFLEHMIVNGSPEFPTKDLLAEHIESVGGAYSAATWQEYIRVNAEVSDKLDYERVTDIFNAMLCRPLMDEKVFENEKKVVIKEIQRNNSNPAKILSNTVKKLFFKETPFEHEVLGNEVSVSGLVYSDVILEYKKLFDKSRITFVVSGDILIDELLKYLGKLSFLEGNDFIQDNNEFDIRNNKKILATFFDAPQTHISFGVPAPELYTKESLHLFLLGQILAGGRASRLAKRLRYSKGLVYAVGFIRYGGQKFGSWSVVTDTTDNKVQEVINEIIEELKDIKKNGVIESELEFIKNKNMKSLKRTMQTSEAWVDFHVAPEAFSKETYNINTFVRDIKDTKIEDIKKIIDKYFRDDRWKLALCGRTKEESVTMNW